MAAVSESFGRFAAVDRSALAVGVVGGLALVVAFVAFLLESTLTVIPVVVFVASVVYGWGRHQAETARALSFLATVVVVVVLGLITVYIVYQSLPAFRAAGLGLITRTAEPMWNPGEGFYSLVPMMWGTLVATLLATLVAGPLGVAGALFLSELAPRRVAMVVEPAVEVLAGIPSIVYGFIGFTILNQYAQRELLLPTTGSLFVAGVVVGVMALPTVVSVAEDAISSVPEPTKNGALAMGATEWQTMKSITLPAAFSGVSAAVLLGVGRAVGETMAATVILGHQRVLPDPLTDVFGNTETLTSLIAIQYGSADGVYFNVLFAAGVVLFVTVMVLSLASQVIELRMQRSLGGNQ